jgi:hypothetical protein
MVPGATRAGLAAVRGVPGLLTSGVRECCHVEYSDDVAQQGPPGRPARRGGADLSGVGASLAGRPLVVLTRGGSRS